MLDYIRKITQKFRSLGLISMVAIVSVFASSGIVQAKASTPTILSQFNGVHDETTAPPSDNIAVNSSTILELVNSQYAIYNRSGNGVSGPISNLANANGAFLSDPQVMWDPSTNRFYFSLMENAGSSSPNEGIAWGFSKNANPTSTTDFCTYFNNFNYGASSYPDRQSLGDTSQYLLIGADRYSTTNEDLLGSDLAWISKPPSGKSCPAASSFATGISPLQNPGGGSSPYSPVPARQIDSSSTGWVTGIPGNGPDSTLSLFQVTLDSSSNTANITASNVTVPAYSQPPSAPQPGLTSTGAPAPPLETREYLTQVIESYDPTFGHVDLWTAHTIAGGAGSEVRWYEINPSANSLDRIGTVSDPNLSVYNATIAPDRLVNGSTSAYGENAVVDFNTSSPTAYTAIRVVSVVKGTQSPMQLIKQSKGPDVDFTCYEPDETYCRWGDYSSATPDPDAPTSSNKGQVWISNQWNVSNINDSDAVWRITIANIKP